MKAGRIAAWAIAAVAIPGLAACSGTSSGSSPASPGSSSAAGTSSPAQSQAGSQASSQPAAQGQAAGSGSLTPPGAHLAFGGPATVGWVPPSQDTGTGAHHGIKLRITVVSIQKGTMADFRNVELNGNERKSTPYYVQLRVTALSSTPVPKDSDPAITFTAIDDRGQQQQSITFLGTFSRCDDPMPPKQFVSGKTYESCLAYLIPGGGSIQKVQWDNGPAAANEVTPYFDRPIVWG
ncbi:MAG TPA: hypothetical protein VK584_05485 [Streptosporangiaceae bacterium]|nr:hypothetical protein [Streptosporangiaceae bacterium]